MRGVVAVACRHHFLHTAKPKAQPRPTEWPLPCVANFRDASKVEPGKAVKSLGAGWSENLIHSLPPVQIGETSGQISLLLIFGGALLYSFVVLPVLVITSWVAVTWEQFSLLMCSDVDCGSCLGGHLANVTQIQGHCSPLHGIWTSISF